MADTQPAVAAAKVRENRWDELEVPPVGVLDQWSPHLRTSIVIPAWNVGGPLQRCLAALVLQTYPHDLLEVVVADDGSDPAVSVPDDAGDLSVRVVRQEHLGFGAGRARNLGAAHATGDVLLFLDADMLLDPQAVEAHLRWHHVAGDVVTLGRRRHADFADLTPADLARIEGVDGWRAVTDAREQWSVEWIDAYMAKHDQMRGPDDEAFRLTTGANVALRRDLFSEVGGFSAFGIRGIEDTELGYRLWNAGAVLIWDVDALGWHDGRSFFQTGGAERAKRERAAAMADHLPTPRFRTPAPGRSYAVPWMVVHMAVHDHPAAQVATAVEAVLGSDRHDLVVSITRDPDSPEAGALDRALASDPRVRISDGTPEPAHRRSLLQAWLPPDAAVSPTTLSLLAERLRAGECGVVRATVPGVAPAAARIRVARTRALSRAERLASTPADVDRLMAELFGEAWVVGADVGVLRVDPDGTASGERESGEVLATLPAAEVVAGVQRRLDAVDARIRALETRVPAASARSGDRWRSSGGVLRRGLRRLARVRSADDVRGLVASVRRRLGA